MDEQTWNRWRRDWEWVLAAMEQKNAMPSDLQVKPPIGVEALELLVKEHNLILPAEFKGVLTNFSAGVKFNWTLDVVPKPPPDPYDYMQGPGELWSVDTLPIFKEHLNRIMRLHCPDPMTDDPWCCAWRHKTAFFQVGNGDYVAFDVTHGQDNCPVIYLDHEGADFNGRRLGLNFIDFVTRWSNIGCPDPIHLYRFYDANQNLMMDTGEIVENWKRWVGE